MLNNEGMGAMHRGEHHEAVINEVVHRRDPSLPLVRQRGSAGFPRYHDSLRLNG